MITALPTPAEHARARRAAADIVAAAAAKADISAVTVLGSDHQVLGRDAWAIWALAAEQRRPYTDQGAARFHAVQRALHQLHQALPRMREEVASLTAQARPLMPAPWQPRPVEHLPGPAWLPLLAEGQLSSPAVP
ncbi:hypothetical protein ABZ826_38980 [Streptomyces sp. NPDC047515]|uniref:hypothetical protein n=1 Tax=Streptomyces sp. NPDC047515 TaxID=3155380 RepID=UPI0033D2B5E0